MKTDQKTLDRVYAMAFGTVYPLYVTKVERKGRTVAELDEVLCWLTGHTPASLRKAASSGVDLRTFFAKAPRYNPSAELITGVICGVRVEDIEDPVMKQVRQMDKVVDEVANGKAMEKVKRTPPTTAAATPKKATSATPAKKASSKAAKATVKKATRPKPARTT